MSRFLLSLLLLASSVQAADAKKTPLVAVMYFDVQSQDAQVQLLRKGLLQMITTDLANYPQVRVVDRDRLEEILAEQKLQSGASVDQASAVKVGKLLAANYFVSGTVLTQEKKTMFICQIRSVETGQVLFGTKVMGENEDVFDAEQKLVTGLIEALSKAEKFPPPDPVKHASMKAPLKVLEKYGQALDAIDKKDKVSAKAKLQEVVKEQPDFVLASIDLDKLMK